MSAVILIGAETWKNLMLRLKKICFNLYLEKTKHLHGQITTAITSKFFMRVYNGTEKTTTIKHLCVQTLGDSGK